MSQFEDFYLINNETQLLTSSLDGTIKIWNLENLLMEKLIVDLPEYIESFYHKSE